MREAIQRTITVVQYPSGWPGDVPWECQQDFDAMGKRSAISIQHSVRKHPSAPSTICSAWLLPSCNHAEMTDGATPCSTRAECRWL